MKRALQGVCAVAAILFATAAAAGAHNVNPGDIFTADSNAFGGPGGVIRLDRVSGDQATVSSGGSFDAPVAIALAPNGDLLVADTTAGSGSVIRVNPVTGAQATVTSNLGSFNPAGIALAPNGNIYVTSRFGAAVVRVDPVTGAQTPFSGGGGFVQPVGLTVAPGGNILVTDWAASPRVVFRVDEATGFKTPIASAGSFSEPFGIAVESSGDVLVADSGAFGGTGGVIRVNPGTGAQSIVSLGGSFVDPRDIAISANGDVFIADFAAFGGGGGIIRVDPLTGAQTTVSSGGLFVDPRGVAIADFLRFEAPAGPNTLLLRRDGSSLELVDQLGAVVASGPLAYAKSATIVGSPDNDTLIIDYRNGYFSLPGGISFNAQGGGDRITVLRGNGEFDLSDFSLTGPGLDVTLDNVEQATISTGLGNDTIDASGFNGPVVLKGGPGNDLIIGGSQSDGLTGGPGDDELDGGDGFDAVDESADVDFRLTNTSLTGPGYDSLANIEYAFLTGGASGNVFNVTGWTQNGTLTGGSGSDQVVSRNNADFTLDNTSLSRSTGGSFILSGIEEATLTGGTGANTLDASGFTGEATLRGAAGSDVLIVGAGDDTAVGGTGTDRVQATGNVSFTLTNTLLLGLGEDALISIERATLNGGSGNNTINARAFSGAVVLNGNAAVDTLRGGRSGDVLTGGPGADRMYGYAGNDTFNAIDGVRDLIDGGLGRDICHCDSLDTKRNVP